MALRLIVLLTLFGGVSRAEGRSPWRVQSYQPGAFVTSVAVGRDGTLWLASRTGLLRFDGTQFIRLTSLPPTSDLPDQLLVDGRGILWWRTAGIGMGWLSAPGVAPYPSPGEGPPPGLVTAMTCDKGGTLWAASGGDLWRHADDHWQKMPGGNSSTVITRLWPATDGTLWAESTGGWGQLVPQGLVAVPPTAAPRRDHLLGTKVSPELLDHLRWATIESVLTDRRGRVWIATDGELICADGQNFQILTAKDGLPDSHVHSLAEDGEGNIWAVTHGGGLARISGSVITTLTSRDGLPSDTPFAVAESSDGSLWVTSVGGLSHIVNGQIETVDLGPAVVSGTLRSLRIARDGTVWITSLGGRLVQLPGGSGPARVHQIPGNHPGITAISEDPAGGVRLGTRSGALLQFEEGTFRELLPGRAACPDVTSDGMFCRQSITALSLKEGGGLWVGTFHEGLWSWDPSGGTQLDLDLGAPPASIWSISASGGEIRLATDHGLYWRKGDQTRRLSMTNGLFENSVFDALEDQVGGLWLAGVRGVTQLTMTDPTTPVLYTSADGLPSDMTMGVYDPTAIRTRDGRLWFVTASGLAIFAPDRDPWALPPPPVHVEQISIDKTLQIYPFIAPNFSVPPGRGEANIEYNASAFTAPHRLHFRYRLDGQDEDWIDAGTRRLAHYTNLRPGHYRFQVGAFRDNHPRVVAFATLNFVLRPHFYQTPLFFILLALGMAAALVGLAAVRSRQVRARFEVISSERRRIARDLHDSLAQVFSALSFQVDSLGRSLPEGDPSAPDSGRLNQLRKMVAQGRRSTRAVVWNLRATSDESRSLEQALQELTGLYDEIEVSLTLVGIPYVLPLVVRTEALSIAQQAVTNALEHGAPQYVAIEVEYAGQRFALWIRDNGIGFAPTSSPERGGRFGLSGMRERAARAGGNLVVESAPEVGTEVGFLVNVTWSKRKGWP